ncbi:MAG: nitroreductase [Deltaproteobacteria bacterium]|nr:MAG: nitroreductase [Deltaproteobacteria bacterium]
MEVLEAIRSRKSIRAFRPDPVPEHILIKLLGVATRAPSAVNLQPWEFFVVRGKALKEVKSAYLKDYRFGKLPDPDIPVGDTRDIAPVLKGVYKERQVTLAKQIFKIMGITKANKKKEWSEKMVQFYDAPAVIIVAVDNVLQSNWPILDVGLVTQNIALAAPEFGLSTCIMRAIVDYPKRLRKIVGIPESKRIMIGLAIGYPDWEHPITGIKTAREQIENIVTFVG